MKKRSIRRAAAGAAALLMLLLTACSAETRPPQSDESADTTVSRTEGTSMTGETHTESTTGTTAEAPLPAAGGTRIEGAALSGAVRLLGRYLWDEETQGVCFSFTNSGFELEFTGTRLDAEFGIDLDSLRGKLNRPFVNVYVEDMETPTQTFTMDALHKTVTLFSAETPRTVKIRVLKRSEAQSSSIELVALQSGEGDALQPTAPAARALEFIGDSFTCGYGNEGELGQEFCTETENGCETYAARTARAFGADLQCICWSGIGVLSNYTEQGEHPNDAFLMKDLYPVTDYAGSGRLGQEQKRYEGQDWHPDAVVIHLGTNDASYTQRAADREAARDSFEAAYEALVETVRERHPQAMLILALGPASGESEELYHRIERVAERRRVAGDDRIQTLLFAPTQEGEGLGAGWHPSQKTHARMAGELTALLRDCMSWE